MQLPGKNTLKKAFLAATAVSALGLGGCAVVPYDAPPVRGGVYIEPILPIPYIVPYGHDHHDRHDGYRREYRPAPRHDGRGHRR
ncbi:MAG: hypothetical protein GC185_12120 [Alphaproteobacteria bacterium]|nr:hypothetical protein [Alphaproteobacteria bacterium]